MSVFSGAYNPIKTGMIIAYGSTDIPEGFLKCDGSAISRTTYADLFSVIGTRYGAGDGSTTFNIPIGNIPVGIAYPVYMGNEAADSALTSPVFYKNDGTKEGAQYSNRGMSTVLGINPSSSVLTRFDIGSNTYQNHSNTYLKAKTVMQNPAFYGTAFIKY